MIVAFALLTQLVTTQCTARPGAPALDHAIIVVHDVDRAADAFRSHGFRIKRGRLHANGLDNRHVKFPDGTEIELMTVRGEPGDAMARRYVDLLNAGEGGVYVALKVRSIDEAERHAARANLSTRRSGSGPWQFLGFNDTTAAAVFFTAGGAPAQDADSIFQHEPRVSSFDQVWLEGGNQLLHLMRALGAVDCGSLQAPDGRKGQRLVLSKGSVVILPMRGRQRPRVVGAVLASRACKEKLRYPHPQFWVLCKEE